MLSGLSWRTTEAREIWPWAEDQICLASEGMTIALDGEGVRLAPG